MARLAQSAERKALNLVVVGSSPTVGVPVRTGEHSVCLRKTLGGCTTVNWGRSGVPQKNVNTLYTKNKFDIRPEVWAISVDLQAWWPSPSQSSPPPQSKHDTEEDTKEARGSHRKQAAKAPTHRKAGTFKINVCACRVYTRRGPQTQQQTAHTCSKPGFGHICSASQLHIGWPTAIGC